MSAPAGRSIASLHTDQRAAAVVPFVGRRVTVTADEGNRRKYRQTFTGDALMVAPIWGNSNGTHVLVMLLDDDTPRVIPVTVIQRIDPATDTDT